MRLLAGNFLIWVILCLFAATSFYAPISSAQSTQSDVINAPDFTVQSLENRIAASDSNREVADANRQVISAHYKSAIKHLYAAADEKQKSAAVALEFENAQQVIDGLRNRIDQLRNQPLDAVDDVEVRTDAELQRLDQERILAEGDLRSFENEISDYRNAIQAQTKLSIQDELSRAQEALNTQLNRMDAIGSDSLGPVETSSRTMQEARVFEWRNHIQALEQEIAFQPTRLQILELRRDLAQLNFDATNRRLVTLQLKTGKRRLSQAEDIYQDIQSGFSVLEKVHPFVLDYAAENLSIAGLLRESASEVSYYPRIRAETRQQLSEIENDLEVADRLTTIGEFNRQSSATIRQLRDQRPSSKSIQAQVASNRKRELHTTQQQLWARQELRRLPVGQMNFTDVFLNWQLQNPGHPQLAMTDIDILNSLHTQKRTLLNQYADFISNEYRETRQLKIVQERLVDTAGKLNNILDQNLLWLPSVRAIDGEWPKRALRGSQTVFSFKNLSRSSGAIIQEMRQYWFIFFIAIIAASLLIGLKTRLRSYIQETSGFVGRVQKDSYWHSPGVLLSTALVSAPIPILLFAIGIVFKNSSIQDAFIDALGLALIELSGFLWFFLIWKEWNRDKSLFDSHYRAPHFFRHNTMQNLRWFIPAAGLSTALVTLTRDSRLPDVYEGFSVMVFIITAFILAVFGIRLLKMDKAVLTTHFSEANLIRRYYRPLIITVTLFPVAAAILAAVGYYDTARVLLSRLFLTAGITLATYALYGLLRRTLLVAQRRISLRQAQEKLEKLRQTRKEQAEAEERGETALPQVDYEEIDVETLNRQSVQLINTSIALGFAVIMWVVWRDLFPALSVFDDVTIFTGGTEIVDGVTQSLPDVTLWNLIQSLAIAALTFIAAKNIPNLLDVFVLNRSRLDRGTRYATTSVLGYIIFAIGFVAAFNKLGMDWSQLQWIVAALSVGIGFGLQEIIANFISGLIILFERPIRVGDYITIGEKSGTVRRIQIRATTLSDLDNREIFIPNKELITQKVTNWTLTDSITRIIIPVGIAYGSDTEKAREIMLDVLNNNRRVLTQPKSNVFFLGFGESSLDFELRIYVRSVDDRFAVSHDIHTDINKALGEAGFEIPFPQRDMHIRSQPKT